MTITLKMTEKQLEEKITTIVKKVLDEMPQTNMTRPELDAKVKELVEESN